MKRIFMIICLAIAFLLATLNTNAQTPMSFSAQGGYSWLNGVLGVEAQIGNFGISGGWMPTKMPLSKDRINSFSGAISYYTLKTGEEGYSYYATVAMSSHGYRYEDSWGGESTMPITIVGMGIKYETSGVWSKIGGGYGWCSEGEAWTFEISLGFILFGN